MDLDAEGAISVGEQGGGDGAVSDPDICRHVRATGGPTIVTAFGHGHRRLRVRLDLEVADAPTGVG